MTFDVQGARKAGYSDAEIATFLAKEKGLDLQAAKKAGYSDSEVIGHFTGTEVRPAEPSFIEQATSNLSPVNDPSKMAGAGTQAIASLPTNMKERASYFAKQRFPDDPNGVARYGVQDGRLFYQGDDGQYYFEEPKLSASPTEVAKYGASLAGPALPFTGGIVGGVATAPAGGVPGAGLGAAAGDEMRQALAMMLADQKDFKPGQSIKEAALAAGGQTIGVGVGKGINKWRGVPQDAYTLKDPAKQKAMSDLQRWAKDFGIDLTPAEITNLSSLKSTQNVLGDMPASSDIMQEFYAKRNKEQVPGAVNKILGEISPVESTEVGARNLQAGAEQTISAAKTERAAASSDLYKEVFPKRISPSLLTNISGGNNIISNAIKGARRDEVTQYYINKYEQETGKKIADNSVGFLDAVKQSLDGKAAAASRSGDNKAAKAYAESAEQLRTKIDQMVPKYKEARSAYAGESPKVDALTKGEVGLVAEAKQTNLSRVPEIIFKSGPKAVSQNRAAYRAAGKEQEWNDGLRSYLQQQFDKASKEMISGNANPGARFKNLIVGSQQQKMSLQNAMTPDQWSGFNRLMDVLEATGRVPQGGSRTAFAQQAMTDMKRRSGGALVPTALNPVNALGRMQNAYQEMMLGRHSEKLARIITSPDSVQKLKSLRGLDPRGIRAMGITAQILEDVGIGAIQTEGRAAPGAL